MENEFLDYDSEKEIYVVDDFYESMGGERSNILSQLHHSNDKLEGLKTDNRNKFNKIKLLLYHKFLNILFSILGSNVKNSFRIFFEKVKFTKINTMGYKIDSDNKSHKNLKEAKGKENKMVKEISHETEYKKHQEKLKLEKLKKEEKKKFHDDLINQERYADNIYIYILRRKFFRKLILIYEMNNLAKIFLTKIYNQSLKKKYLQLLSFISNTKIEKKITLENIKLETSFKFFNFNLKIKIFNYFFELLLMNRKIVAYYIKAFKTKKKKIIQKKFMEALICILSNLKKKEKDTKIILLKKYKTIYSKKIFKFLKINLEQTKENKLKEDIIKKLKIKVQILLGENFDT